MDISPYILPIATLAVLIFLMYFFFIRPLSDGMGGSIARGVTSKSLGKKGQKVTFSDVAGIDYVREELEEVVDLIKNKEKYESIGARVPKGILCTGEPGTGKTLMARAVAGEAGCSFFSVSGSDFIEVFVGVGASRIRKMFAEARKNAPCIIFIDEIDAIGGHRGTGVSGGHSEREQTLNQLLVEMDGFEASAGVVIMAATNRADTLDKALLRPGRFDRIIKVELPNSREREEILKVHAKKIKISEGASLRQIAQATPGCSGADLANIINEAALIAIKLNKEVVDTKDLIEARDKVLYGKSRTGRVIKDKDKKLTAYHEAGHAVVSIILESDNTVEKVTIIPRGASLGATHFLPEDDKVSMSRGSMVKEIAVLMAGRAAEEFFLEDISSGASMDIDMASSIARNYVCSYGMDDVIGLVSYDTRFGGDSMNASKVRPSENTLELIDKQVRSLISNSYVTAMNIIKENKDKVIKIADALLKHETIFAEDIKSILNGTWTGPIDESKNLIDEVKEVAKDTINDISESIDDITKSTEKSNI